MKKISLRKGILLILFVITLFYILHLLLKNEITNYQNDYFNLSLDSDYSIKHIGKYKVAISYKNKNCTTIEINPKCGYSDDITSIISNWIGMHAYIKEVYTSQERDKYFFYKVLVGIERSAAQIENNEEETDQLHLFYITRDKTLIDVEINTKFINSNSIIDNIESSLTIK